jgi:hypothetical protein
LILFIPDLKHKVIHSQVATIDLMPTILDLLKIDIPNKIQGHGFLNLIIGKEEINRTTYSLYGPLVVIRKNNYKLIYNRESNNKEFYDIGVDKKEIHNLINENLTVEKKLENELLDWLEIRKNEIRNLNFSIKEFYYPKFSVPSPVNVSEKSIDIVSTNPDIIYETNQLRNSSEIDFEELPQNFWYPWSSDGYYLKGSIPENSNNYGIVLIHPINFTTPRFLAQNITLINEVYILVAEFANIANYFNHSCGDSDAIVKIKILDYTSNDEFIIYEDIIKESDGWKKIALVLNGYQNKNITFKIEGYSGGYGGEWCGEYAAVNKFYVGKLKEKIKINETLQQKIEERLKELGYVR